MKAFNQISLRLRLTILMGVVLTVSCVGFMFASIISAGDTYKMPINKDLIRIHPYPLYIEARIEEPIAIIKKRQEQNNEFAKKNVLIAVLIIVIGTGATYIISAKALKPVTGLSEEVGRIDEGNLFVRIDEPSSHDEVAKLARAFNNMISKLEKAFTAQKNFSANAAHELKTPLAGIITSIEVLLLDDIPEPKECREVLTDVLKNAERLGDLVNDLLEMKRDLSIRSCERFDFQPMLESILKELSSDILSKNIQVNKSNTTTVIFGEKRLLYRAFANLVHNAVKYNRTSGTITISTAEDDSNISLSIHDTGIGIPEEELARIFEPFYCVDKSRSRELGGSGLGLSIVKSIVEKHGGQMSVESKVGVYTVITVTLPITKSI